MEENKKNEEVEKLEEFEGLEALNNFFKEMVEEMAKSGNKKAILQNELSELIDKVQNKMWSEDTTENKLEEAINLIRQFNKIIDEM